MNTGDEAEIAGQLRGDFYDSDKGGRRRAESTKYTGMDWVECFLVKNGDCAAGAANLLSISHEWKSPPAG